MRFPIIAMLSLLVAQPAQAWGPVGHRITGKIAQDNLSGAARANVRILLGDEDLAEASTWPDDMRSAPGEFWQKAATPWHYVTPKGDAYVPSDAPPEGDAMTALARFTATLRDPKASSDDRRMALRFIVHIIGDLHQPLHVGGAADEGGNKVQVTWFGQSTNLHTIWDSGIIDQRKLSYSEYAAWLERATTPEQVLAWSVRDPAVWLAESFALSKTIYPADPKLSYAYLYQHRLEVDDRLKMAGIRIAAYLNRVFDDPVPATEPARRSRRS